MARGEEIPKTDPAEIEAVIERLKQSNIDRRDVELIERLLRTVMVLVNLLQRKNMSIKRLRDLIFGRHTEKRKAASSSKEEEKPEGNEAIDPVTESKRGERSQREGKATAKGHGRRATHQYRGAQKVECQVAGASPEEILLVDDYEKYIHPGQENQWIKVPYFDYPYSDDDLGLREVLRLLRIRVAS